MEIGEKQTVDATAVPRQRWWSPWGGRLAKLAGVVGFFLSLANSYSSCESARAARQRSETDELSRFSASEAGRPLPAAQWTLLHRFAFKHWDVLAALLGATPATSGSALSTEARQLAASLAAEIPAALFVEADVQLCRAKVEAFSRISRLVGHGLLSAEVVQRELKKDWDRFATDEAFRCFLALEPNGANRALLLAGYYRGGECPDRPLGANPWLALSREDGERIQAMARTFGTEPTRSHRRFAGYLFAGPSVLRFEGCDGALKNVFVDAAVENGWTGKVGFDFTPGWPGSPGRDLGCLHWRSPDGLSGFELGFTKDEVVFRFEVDGVGPSEARVSLKEAQLQQGKTTQLVGEWDFRGLNPEAFLMLRAGPATGKAVAPRAPYEAVRPLNNW